MPVGRCPAAVDPPRARPHLRPGLCNTPNVLPDCRAQLSSPLPSPMLILAPEASRTGQLTSVLKSPTPLPLPLPLARVPRHGRRGHEPSSPPTPRTTCGHEQSHHHRRPNLELSQCLGPFFSLLFRFIFFLTVGGFRFTLSGKPRFDSSWLHLPTTALLRFGCSSILFPSCTGFPTSTSTRHRLCSLWRLPVAPFLRLSFG